MQARYRPFWDLCLTSEVESLNIEINAIKDQKNRKADLIDLYLKKIGIHELLLLKNRNNETLKALLYSDHFEIVTLTDPQSPNYQWHLDQAIMYIKKIKNLNDKHYRVLATMHLIKARTMSTDNESKASMLGRSIFVRSLIKNKNCDDHRAIYENTLEVLSALIKLRRYKAGIYACNQALESLCFIENVPSSESEKQQKLNKIKQRFVEQSKNSLIDQTKSANLTIKSVFTNKRPLSKAPDSKRPHKVRKTRK